MHQQAVTRPGLRLRIRRGEGLLAAAQGRLGRRPGVPCRLGHATPPRLIRKPQGPVGMTARPAEQAGAGSFLRVDAGAGLGSHRLARGPLPPRRRTAVRSAARLTRWGLRPGATLTSAAHSRAHSLLGWPQVPGLWCHKAWRCWAPALPPRARLGCGREEGRGRHAPPGVVQAGRVLRPGWSLPPLWRALRGTPAPSALAKMLWPRRPRQASAARRPAVRGRRSAAVTARTKTAG